MRGLQGAGLALLALSSLVLLAAEAKPASPKGKEALYDVPNWVEERTKMHFPQAEAGWLDRAAAGEIGDDVKTDDEKGNLTAIIKEWHDKAYAEKAQARVDAFNKALEDNYDEYNTTLGKALHKVFKGKQVKGSTKKLASKPKTPQTLNSVKDAHHPQPESVIHKAAKMAETTLTKLFEIPMQPDDCVGSDCYNQEEFDNPAPEGQEGEAEGSGAEEGAEGSGSGDEGAEGSGAAEAAEGSGSGADGAEESEGSGSGAEGEESSGSGAEGGKEAEGAEGAEGSGSGAEGTGSGAEEAEGAEGAEHPITVDITDASTGLGVASKGAVRFEKNGEAVKVVDFDAGAEEVTVELPSGTYSMLIIAEGYTTEAQEIMVPAANPFRALVSQALGPQEMEISMTWDPEVTDMDMHIALPSGCVVYRLNQKCSWGNMVAEMTAENRSSGGPLTVKITDVMPGDYAIYATRFTVGHKILRSQAKARVSLPGGKVKYLELGQRGVIGELTPMEHADLPTKADAGAISTGAGLQMRRGGRKFKAGGLANSWFATILRYGGGQYTTCHADKSPLCSAWSAGDVDPAKSSTGYVYGHVLDIDTGSPVPSVNVDLIFSGSPAVRTHAGVDGSFLLQAVPAGFELIAHRAGYCVESEDVRMQSGVSKKRRLFLGRELLFKQMRIAVTWGDDALDSTIHVTTPTGCTIDTTNPSCTSKDLDGSLDHNKNRLHGPKTVLFSRVTNGNFGIYVSRAGGESVEGKYIKVRIQFPGCSVTSTRRYKLSYGDGELGSGIGADFAPGGDKTVWKVGTIVADGPDFCVAGKDNGCTPKAEPAEIEGEKEAKEKPEPEEPEAAEEEQEEAEGEEEDEENKEIEKEDQQVEDAPIVFGGDDMPKFGGYIQDSKTGYKMNRVQVQLMWGGQAVLDYRSKSWGRFKFNAPPAPYQVKASMAGYVTASENVRLAEDGTQYGKLPVRIVLSKILEPGQLRIVLTWNLKPKHADFDLHVVTPLNIGRRYPIACRIGPGRNGGYCGRKYARRRPRKDEDYIYGRQDADWRHDGGPKSVWFDRMLDGTYYVYATRDDKGTKTRSGKRAERLRERYGLGIPMEETGLRTQIYLPKTGAEGIRDYKIERGEGVVGEAKVIDKRNGGGIDFTPKAKGAEGVNAWFVAEIVVSGGHPTIKSTNQAEPGADASDGSGDEEKAQGGSKLVGGVIGAKVAKNARVAAVTNKPQLSAPARERLLAIWASKGHQQAQEPAGGNAILFACGGALLLMGSAVAVRISRSWRRGQEDEGSGVSVAL